MYNASAVPCRAICIATTVIIRVRAIDICSLERVYISRDTSSSRGLTSRTETLASAQTGTKARGTRKVATVSVAFRAGTIDQFWDKSGSVPASSNSGRRFSLPPRRAGSDCLLCYLESIADFLWYQANLRRQQMIRGDIKHQFSIRTKIDNAESNIFAGFRRYSSSKTRLSFDTFECRANFTWLSIHATNDPCYPIYYTFL